MFRESIADYEIPYLEERFSDGDREAGERLVRFYEAQIASMAIRRDRILRAMEAADQAPRDEAGEVDEDLRELED
jgi:uncharacterized membrane protein